jgi:hypothetical protein
MVRLQIGPDAPIKHRDLCASASPQEAAFEQSLADACTIMAIALTDIARLRQFPKQTRRSEVKAEHRSSCYQPAL